MSATQPDAKRRMYGVLRVAPVSNRCPMRQRYRLGRPGGLRPRLENPFPNVLSCGLNVLHRFADTRTSRLIAASRLVYVVARRFDELLELFEFLHRGTPA